MKIGSDSENNKKFKDQLGLIEVALNKLSRVDAERCMVLSREYREELKQDVFWLLEQGQLPDTSYGALLRLHTRCTDALNEALAQELEHYSSKYIRTPQVYRKEQAVYARIRKALSSYYGLSLGMSESESEEKQNLMVELESLFNICRERDLDFALWRRLERRQSLLRSAYLMLTVLISMVAAVMSFFMIVRRY